MTTGGVPLFLCLTLQSPLQMLSHSLGNKLCISSPEARPITHPTTASLHHPQLDLCVPLQAVLTHQAGGNVLHASVLNKTPGFFFLKKRAINLLNICQVFPTMHLLEIPGNGRAKPIAARVLGTDLSPEPTGRQHGTTASLLPSQQCTPE